MVNIIVNETTMQSESTYATQKKYSDSKYGRCRSLSDNAMQSHMLQKSGWVEENEITRMAAVKTKFLRNLDLNGTPSHLHIYNLSTSAAWNGYVLYGRCVHFCEMLMYVSNKRQVHKRTPLRIEPEPRLLNCLRIESTATRALCAWR